MHASESIILLIILLLCSSLYQVLRLSLPNAHTAEAQKFIGHTRGFNIEYFVPLQNSFIAIETLYCRLLSTSILSYKPFSMLAFIFNPIFLHSVVFNWSDCKTVPILLGLIVGQTVVFFQFIC